MRRLVERAAEIGGHARLSPGPPRRLALEIDDLPRLDVPLALAARLEPVGELDLQRDQPRIVLADRARHRLELGGKRVDILKRAVAGERVIETVARDEGAPRIGG